MGPVTICGIDELQNFKDHFFSHILSFLDPDRAHPDIFSSYKAHKSTILRFHDIINESPGLQEPKKEDIETILSFGKKITKLIENKEKIKLLVHCHMGISRSSAAVIILLAQAHPHVLEKT